MMKPNGTEQTRAVAERIRDVSERYRELGIPVFIICYAFDDEDHTTANGGLYMVEYKPERGDIMVRKEEMSPFLHSDIGGKNIDAVLMTYGRPVRADGFSVVVLRRVSTGPLTVN